MQQTHQIGANHPFSSYPTHSNHTQMVNHVPKLSAIQQSRIIRSAGKSLKRLRSVNIEPDQQAFDHKDLKTSESILCNAYNQPQLKRLKVDVCTNKNISKAQLQTLAMLAYDPIIDQIIKSSAKQQQLNAFSKSQVNRNPSKDLMQSVLSTNYVCNETVCNMDSKQSHRSMNAFADDIDSNTAYAAYRSSDTNRSLVCDSDTQINANTETSTSVAMTSTAITAASYATHNTQCDCSQCNIQYPCTASMFLESPSPFVCDDLLLQFPEMDQNYDHPLVSTTKEYKEINTPQCEACCPCCCALTEPNHINMRF